MKAVWLHRVEEVEFTRRSKEKCRRFDFDIYFRDGLSHPPYAWYEKGYRSSYVNESGFNNYWWDWYLYLNNVGAPRIPLKCEVKLRWLEEVKVLDDRYGVAEGWHDFPFLSFSSDIFSWKIFEDKPVRLRRGQPH